MKYLASAGLALLAFLAASAPASASPPPPVVVIAATPDGAILIEGRKFTTAKAYEAKIAEIERRQPRPGLVVSARDMNDIMRTIKILEAIGVAKIAFLVEPKAK